MKISSIQRFCEESLLEISEHKTLCMISSGSKFVEQKMDIERLLSTLNEPVSYKSTKYMLFDMPYEIIKIEKILTAYGEKIRVTLKINEETFTVWLPKRYVEVFVKEHIDLFNRNAKYLTLTRCHGATSDQFRFALSINVWLP